MPRKEPLEKKRCQDVDSRFTNHVICHNIGRFYADAGKWYCKKHAPNRELLKPKQEPVSSATQSVVAEVHRNCGGMIRLVGSVWQCPVCHAAPVSVEETVRTQRPTTDDFDRVVGAASAMGDLPAPHDTNEALREVLTRLNRLDVAVSQVLSLAQETLNRLKTSRASDDAEEGNARGTRTSASSYKYGDTSLDLKCMYRKNTDSRMCGKPCAEGDFCFCELHTKNSAQKVHREKRADLSTGSIIGEAFKAAKTGKSKFSESRPAMDDPHIHTKLEPLKLKSTPRFTKTTKTSDKGEE